MLFAAMIWGTGFVAQTEASDSIPAFTFNACRSFVAALFLALVILVTPIANKKAGLKDLLIDRSTLLGGSICGVLMFFASFCQQQGITLYPDDAAASGRAGFITATYVVMVAVYSLIKDKRLQIPVLIAVPGCILGMYFLCLSKGIGKIYRGDIWVLLCALGFAVHLIVIDRFTKCNPIKMSFVQFFVCGVFSLIFALGFDGNLPVFTIDMVGCILYAGVLSSGVAYTFQMAGQKHTSPTVSSIIMSLESVFAVLAGWLLLQERLSFKEAIGCILVFASVILSQMPDFKKAKKD